MKYITLRKLNYPDRFNIHAEYGHNINIMDVGEHWIIGERPAFVIGYRANKHRAGYKKSLGVSQPRLRGKRSRQQD